jgi:hypothetical protein
MCISNTPSFANPTGIALRPNIPLYFVSAASPVFSNNAININNAWVKEGQPVVLWDLGYAELVWNSAWLFTPDGMIIPYAFPQWVLGVNGSDVVICERNDSDTSQYWTIAGTPGTYTIVNNQTQEAITALDTQQVYTGDTYSTQLTTAAISAAPATGQLWGVQPYIIQQPPNNQFYIQTALSGNVGSSADPYMLAANSSGAVLEQWQPGAQSQLWIFNADGTIASAADQGLVLNPTSSSNKSDNQVTLVAPTGSTAQQWTYSNNQLSVDMGGSIGTLYLNVDNSKQYNGAGVITWEQTNANNGAWYTFSAQCIPIGEWFYLQTEMTDGSGNDSPFVLAISDGVAAAGTGVVIEPLQTGALDQLWQINAQGVIISALDQTLALTANSQSDNPVTINTIQSDLSGQQWYRLSNGMLAVGASGNVFYLNVQGGGNAAAGTAVITDNYQSNASNVLWNPIPYVYEPEPSGLWFTIQTALTEPGTEIPYLLTAVRDRSVCLTPQPEGYVLPQGQAAINQLWRKTLNGNIVSAINPNLVLTAPSAGNVTLAPMQSDSANQQWFWGYSQTTIIGTEGQSKSVACGILQNVGQSQVLWALSASNINVTLQQAATTNNTANQLWYMFPNGPVYEQSTTIRNIGGTDEVAGLFLSIPAKPDSSKIYAAAVNEQSGDQALFMWLFSYPGFIVSAINSDIVLSLEVGPGSTAQNPVYTNNVVAYFRQPGAQPFQLWTADTAGTIINQYNGLALAASAASAPSSVITTALASNHADAKTSLQLWDFSPGMALQTTLAQPPVPYPAWTTGQATAYTAICNELGLPGGIRAQYANLAAPLNNYQLQINLIALPLINDGGVLLNGNKPSKEEVADWVSVVTQLNKEITAATAVQLLFAQATALHLSLSQAQAMTLSELVTGCALPDQLQTKIKPQKKKRSWIGDLIEGVAYTALNVAGSFVDDPEMGKQAALGVKFVKNGLPCIANLMSTGFSIYQGVGSSKASSQTAKYKSAFNKAMKNAYNYEMTVLEMQQALLSEFEAIGSTLGQIEALILADWGKLQDVYNMTRDTGSISSLFWPSTMTPMQANQMLSGYTIGVLQTLLPANAGFKINATMHTNCGDLVSPAGWQSDGSFIENNNDNTQNIYTTTVNQQMMDIVLSNGVDPISFFRGLNGWNLPIDYYTAVASFYTPLWDITACAIFTVQNFTDQELTLAMNLCGLIGSVNSLNAGYTTITIPPYGVQEFAGDSGPVWNPATMQEITDALFGAVAILDSGQQTVMNLSIDNSYQLAGTSWKVPPTYYTVTVMTITEPYTVTIKQNVTQSLMTLGNISIYVTE